MLKDKRKAAERQEKARGVAEQLVRMLWPLQGGLKQKLDGRLVKTVLGLGMAMIMHRHRNKGLVLSEVGGDRLGAEQGRAGTQRISNLIHSQKRNARVIEDFLWQQGRPQVKELGEQGECPLVIWDERVLEKPESLQAEG